jgi:hypothetical protein
MDERLREEFLRSARGRFAELKALGDAALARMDDADLRFTPDPEANSVAVIVQHVAGNMMSRWTEFLTTDGEKPDRNRDAEFVLAEGSTKDKLLALWEKGWARLFDTVGALTTADLDRRVSIRGQPLSVVDAIQRQLTHYGQHVGQIVYIAKHRRWRTWESLSIPRKR